MKNEAENWLSMSEAAGHTPYSAEYLSLLARKKKLSSKKIGNTWYTTRPVLDDYMKKQMIRTQVQNGNFQSLEPLRSYGDDLNKHKIEIGENTVQPQPSPEATAGEAKIESIPVVQKIENLHQDLTRTLQNVIENKFPQHLPAKPLSFGIIFSNRIIIVAGIILLIMMTLLPVPIVFGFLNKSFDAVKEAVQDSNTVLGFRPGTHENELLLLDSEGNIAIMGHVETGGQLKSFVADGVAPIVVDSKTLVKNLNAELLGGASSTDFTLAFVTANGSMTTEDVQLEGNVEVGKTLLVRGAIKLLGTLEVGQNLKVFGEAEFRQALNVFGPAYFESLVTAQSDMVVAGNLDVRKNISLRGSLEAGSSIIARSGSFLYSSVSGDFSAGGVITLGNSDDTLTINSENVSINAAGDAIFDGSVSASSLSVSSFTATTFTTTNSTTTNATTTNLAVSGDLFTSLTTGSVPFIGTDGLLTQNNADLFWDNTNGRLGIGTSTPQSTLSLVQTVNGANIFNARRITDVAPSGDFIEYLNAAGDTTLFRVDNSGNLLAGGIINTGAQTITSISQPQFRVQYDASNEWTASTDSAGISTFGFNGTTPRAIWMPGTDRTDSFQFQNSTGLPVLSIDTTNQRVGVSTTSPWAKFSIGTHNLSQTLPSFVIASSSDTLATTTQFIVVNGNVGIGTTSPFAKLSITGAAGGTTNLLAISTSTAGFATTTALTVDENGNLSLLNGASLTVTGATSFTSTTTFPLAKGNFLVGDDAGNAQATSSIFVSSVGNVGIGTTIPGAQLHITNGSWNGENARFERGYTTFGQGGRLGTAAQVSITGGIDQEQLVLRGFSGQTADVFIAENSGGTDLFNIKSSGNVGIGSTTPNQLLVLSGSVSPTLNISNSDTSLATDEVIGEIQINSNDISTNATGLAGALRWAASTPGSGNNTYLSFLTRCGSACTVNSASADEKMRITHDGNVGIGTTSPASLLHIFGGLSNSGPGGDPYLLTIEDDASTGLAFKTPDGTTQDINFSNVSDTLNARIRWNQSNETLSLGTFTVGGALVFQYDNESEGLRIASTTGNIGIGTTSPYAKLSVQGASDIRQLVVRGHSTQTTNLQEWQRGSDGGMMAAMNGSGRLSLNRGGSTADTFILDLGISENFNTASTLSGITGMLINSGLGSMIGLDGLVETRGSGTVGNASGVRGGVRTNGATTILTSARALEASSPLRLSTSAITNAYGLFINPQTVTGVTNAYGVYSSGASDINYFAGNVGIGVTNPSTFKLEVAGNIGPEADNTRDLGSSARRFANLFATVLNSTNFLATGSTTLQNFTFVNATGSSATTTNFFTTTASSTNLFSSLLNVGSNALNVIANGNVGIGTTTPWRNLLSVEKDSGGGSGTATSYGLTIKDTGVGSIWDTANANSGVDFESSDQSGGYLRARIGTVMEETSGATSRLGFFTAGASNVLSERLSILSGGNVGIGTVAPNSKLNVSYSSTDTTYTASGGRGLEIINTNTTSNNLAELAFRTLDTGGALGSGASIAAVFTNHAESTITSDLAFMTNPTVTEVLTERMRIKADGSIGIGTIAPFSDLDVSSSIATAGLGGGTLTLSRADAGLSTDDPIGKIQFWNNDTQLTTQNIFATIEVQANSLTHDTDAASGNLIFRTTDSTVAGSPVERLRIMYDGKVGIGNSNPKSTLDIRQGTGGVSTSRLTLGPSSGNIDAADVFLSGIQTFNSDASVDGPNMVTSINSYTNGSSGQGGYLTFGTHDGTEGGEDSSPVERLRITGTGNVGIGDTTPTEAKLVVNGDVHIETLANLGSTGRVLCADASDASVVFVNSTSAENCTVSSERFKHDIVDINLGLDTVRELRPVSFTFNGTNEESLGFIAEEVDLIDRRLVAYDNENRPHTVNYSLISAVLTKAVQELDERVTGIWDDTLARMSDWGVTITQSFTRVGNLFAGTLHIENQLCVDDVCISKEQLKALLVQAGGQVYALSEEPAEEPTIETAAEEPAPTATTSEEIITEEVIIEESPTATSSPEILTDDNESAITEPETATSEEVIIEETATEEPVAEEPLTESAVEPGSLSEPSPEV